MRHLVNPQRAMALFLALATLPMLRGPAAAQISNPQLSTAPQLSTPPQPATPQSNFSAAQRAEIGALRADDGRMQEAAARAAINASGPHLTNESGDPIAGNPAGDVTVVEFYDVRCPYCRHMIPVIDQLLASDKGIRMVFKDLPILGPGSVLGSRALLAAQRQDGYMKLQSAIMRGPSDVTEETLKSQALAVGLDWPRLRRDMDDPAIQTRIDLNLALAKAISVEGTPAMIIGGKLLPGAMDLAGMQAAIQQARKEKG